MTKILNIRCIFQAQGFGRGSAPDPVGELIQRCQTCSWLGRETGNSSSLWLRASQWGPGVVKCIGPTRWLIRLWAYSKVTVKLTDVWELQKYLISKSTSFVGMDVWHINISSEIIKPVSCVQDLGFHFDDELSMKQQINTIARTCFYHLRRLRQIRRRAGQEVTVRVVLALVI